MLDMVKPKVQGQIMLNDLKYNKLAPIFFDTFFNLDKYLEHEQKDPFANQRVRLQRMTFAMCITVRVLFLLGHR